VGARDPAPAREAVDKHSSTPTITYNAVITAWETARWLLQGVLVRLLFANVVDAEVCQRCLR